jgi:CheY-like chemotaxis protein
MISLDNSNSIKFKLEPIVKVLVIEDDPIAMRMVTLILKEKGCMAEAVSTGEAAVKYIDKTYHLILLDLGLPGMDGFEVAKIIRGTKGIDAPIIALTSSRSEHNIELAQQLGLNGYIFKPLTLGKCHTLLDKFIFSHWDPTQFYLINDEIPMDGNQNTTSLIY